MTTNSPQVSVLMAVHNGGRFLDQSVRSILTQTLSELEFIIIDDGSSDDTLERLTAWQQRDARLRVSSHNNRGLTFCLNEAARHAQSQYLARMDADDVALPERLAQQRERLDRDSRLVVVGGQALMIDPDGWPIAPWSVPMDHNDIDAWHLRGLGGGIIHPTALIRREAFERIGGYASSLPAAQDFDLWLRLAEVGRMANLAQRVLQYRLHADSVSASRRSLQVACLRSSCEGAWKRRGLAGTPAQSRRQYGHLSALRQRLQWVRMASRAGNGPTARKHLAAAWRQMPLHPLVLVHMAAYMATAWRFRPADHIPAARAGS